MRTLDQEKAHAIATIKDRLSQRKGRIRWTIERGMGETYHSRDWTIYSHDSYPRSSVLAGQERRSWICSFTVQCAADDEPAKQAAIEACKEAGVWKYTDVMDGGTTHIPIAQVVAHLPDDTDY